MRLVSRGCIGVAAALVLLDCVTASAEDIAPPARLRGVERSALTETYAVGSFAPEFAVPAPGSYTLPSIQTINDHPVVDSEGHPTTLLTLKRDRLAVVAFVYTTCAEVTGCPLSEAVLQRVDRALAADADLSRQVTLMTVSFDPERDTPPRMQTVREFYEPKTDWHFLTTASTTQLQPLLDDFNQPVAKLRFADGQWSGLFRHVLKVFLLDRKNQVRNIYSAGFLTADIVLADLRTVLLEGGDAAVQDSGGA